MIDKNEIKYFFVKLSWFFRYRIHCHYSDIKRILNSIIKLLKDTGNTAKQSIFIIENYIYVLLITLFWVLITSPEKKFVIILFMVIIYFHYRDWYGGNFLAYMRNQKGYRGLKTDLKK